METTDFEMLLSNLEENKEEIVEEKEKKEEKKRKKKEKLLEKENLKAAAINLKYSNKKQSYYPNK